jgi:Na+/H+ antiporter NhaD/arsenite permease-like protein
LNQLIGNQKIIVMVLGVLSAVIDNVPLVAATQGMYSLTEFPQDHPFWLFIAYCSGTGGSMLIIGSAAGVAAMGLTKIEFFWYLKRITLWAFLGYLSGALIFIAMSWNQ